MHSIKKIFVSTLSIILAAAVISSGIIIPYLNSESVYYQDRTLRSSLAGQLDFITVGASHIMDGFDPRVLDAQFGCCSYNLAGPLMSLDSEYILLQKEIERNPVKTVVLDLEYQTLLRNGEEEYAVNDEATVARLDSFSERLNYIVHDVHFDDWLNLYARQMMAGAENLLHIISHGTSAKSVIYDQKGFKAQPSQLKPFSMESAASLYNSEVLDLAYPEATINKFRALVDLCKSRQIRVIAVVVPVADERIWKKANLDEFYQYANSLSDELGIEFYDMNLLQNRYDLFSASKSFSDEGHMSAEGAAVFTKAFCDILKYAKTGDVSEYFYPSYQEMKADSPYMESLSLGSPEN